MKKAISIFLVVFVAILAVSVIAVNAVRFGNIDGIWGLVDTTQSNNGTPYATGASCLRYGDGPPDNITDPNIFTSTPGTTSVPDISIMDGNPAVQSTRSTNNWNQIRYGIPQYPTIAPCGLFRNQSGLAFNGANALPTPIDYQLSTPFVLGKMCHINNPIQAATNRFNTTYMDLNISNIDCGPMATRVNESGTPLPPGPLTYRYNMVFDETTNSGTCTYSRGTPIAYITPCPDAVIPSQPQVQQLYCKLQNNTLNYTIAILGFTKSSTTTTCVGQTYNPTNVASGIFISDENKTNCVCLWGVVSDRMPSAIEMNFFNASVGKGEVVLRWQTAFETDNIGFNIYRSDGIDPSQMIKLNTGMIESLVPPGSTYGADYRFVDDLIQPYVSYYYWVEDIDVNGTATLHGPVYAEWEE